MKFKKKKLILILPIKNDIKMIEFPYKMKIKSKTSKFPFNVNNVFQKINK